MPDKQDMSAKFDLTARIGITWYGDAETLKRAADILQAISRSAIERLERLAWEPPRKLGARPVTDEERSLLVDWSLQRVWCFLIGLAIEDLAKGILLSREPSAIDGQGRLRHAHHGLVKLVEECIKIDDAERSSLEELTRYIKWIGRYPIPTKPSDYWGRGEDIDAVVVSGLYERLSQLLLHECPSRASTLLEGLAGPDQSGGA